MGHDLKIEAIPTDTQKYNYWIKSTFHSAVLCLILAIPLQARAGELHDAAQAGDVETVKT